ncbi:MAG: hypothetical protein UZ05_CHB002001511 [Chlorobi bacterium OLB5]|nr:MAG: hypothetical protein UZ05_CHB002001511 [Chlorobi bacterium OLB5]
MKNSKVIQLLRTFNSEELKRLDDFLCSPYFNKKTNVVKLFKALKKFSPLYDSADLNEENIYKMVFPGKSYNYGTMKNLIHEFSTLAKEFMAYQDFGEDHFLKKLDVLYGLASRNLNKFFEPILKETEQAYRTFENLGDEYFKNNFELEIVKLYSHYRTGRAELEPGKRIELAQSSATYLICYSLIVSFKLCHDIMTASPKKDFDYRATLAYKFVESVGTMKLMDSIKACVPEFYPVIAIYFNRFMIASDLDDDDTYYFELKKLIYENLVKFSKAEKFNLIVQIESSCTEKINKGRDFFNDLHEIYNLKLKNNIYTLNDSDFFPVAGFRKIVINAIYLKKFEWTENFIKKYIHQLHEEDRDNTLYFSRALLNFAKGSYNKTLEDISMVKFKDYVIKFYAWSLKLKALFELGYFEDAFYALDSFNHSVKDDNKSPEQARKKVSNFLSLYRKILKLKLEPDKIGNDEMIFLNNKINSTEVLDNIWLKSKINELHTGVKS